MRPPFLIRNRFQPGRAAVWGVIFALTGAMALGIPGAFLGAALGFLTGIEPRPT